MYCVVPENIHTPPTESFFSLNPPPLWKFHFSVILSFKKLCFVKPPSSLEFPLTFLGVGMDIFWNYTFRFTNKHTHKQHAKIENSIISEYITEYI